MDGLAAALSVPVWVYLGDFGAENKDWLLKQIHRFQFGLYAVCLIGGAWLGWRMWRKRRQLLARRDELLEKRRQRRLARRQNQQP